MKYIVLEIRLPLIQLKLLELNQGNVRSFETVPKRPLRVSIISTDNDDRISLIYLNNCMIGSSGVI